MIRRSQSISLQLSLMAKLRVLFHLASLFRVALGSSFSILSFSLMGRSAFLNFNVDWNGSRLYGSAAADETDRQTGPSRAKCDTKPAAAATVALSFLLLSWDGREEEGGMSGGGRATDSLPSFNQRRCRERPFSSTRSLARRRSLGGCCSSARAFDSRSLPRSSCPLRPPP